MPSAEGLEPRRLLSDGGGDPPAEIDTSGEPEENPHAPPRTVVPAAAETTFVWDQFQQYREASWMDAHRVHMAQLQAGRGAAVRFFGDSYLYEWPLLAARAWKNVTGAKGSATFNLGMAGDQVQNVLWRLRNGELAGSPSLVVLLIGTNNYARGDAPQEVAAGVEACVAAVREEAPSADVLVVGLLPTFDSGRNAWIRRTNVLLRAIAVQSGSDYLDLSRPFHDARGRTRRELFRNPDVDPLHLSRRGFEAITPPLARAIRGSIRVARIQRARPRA